MAAAATSWMLVVANSMFGIIGMVAGIVDGVTRVGEGSSWDGRDRWAAAWKPT